MDRERHALLTERVDLGLLLLPRRKRLSIDVGSEGERFD